MDVVRGIDGPRHLLGGDDAPLALHRPEGEAGEDRARPSLVAVDVGQPVADHLVAGGGQEPQANLVGHGAAGGEEGCLLAQEVGHLLLEGVDGGVLAANVVAHLGPVHGLAHGGGGPGDRVGTQIDLEHGAILAWPRNGRPARGAPGKRPAVPPPPEPAGRGARRRKAWSGRPARGGLFFNAPLVCQIPPLNANRLTCCTTCFFSELRRRPNPRMRYTFEGSRGHTHQK